MADEQALAAFARQLQVLRVEYVGTLRERLAKIDDLWAEVRTAWDEELARTLHRQVHSMTGTAGTFGCGELSAQARVAEILLKSVVQQDRPPDGAEYAAIEQALAVVRLEVAAVIRVGAPVAPAGGAVIGSAPAGAGEASTSPVPAAANTRVARNASHRILLAAFEPAVAADLAAQLGHFAYDGEVVADLEGLVGRLDSDLPAALVLGIVGTGREAAALAAVRFLRQRFETLPPVVFVGGRGDTSARAEAVRAGGGAYLSAPVDTSELVEALDRLTGRTEPEPYRILVVDDEPEVARHTCLMLESAGMLVETASDPMAVDRPLEEFAPDLILMDLNMPACSGLELAAAIRQQQRWVGIPIVFLSAETDVSRQVEAMDLGGDRFLAKPVRADELIPEVAARAKRSRLMRSFMARDSLTGLYNHSHIAELLETEVARARRNVQPLCYAMLDLDLFKRVNDVRGHAIGDRVLKSLAHLLQQRLRKTDITGRYGGEEFAIVLPDTAASGALQVLKEVLTAFAQIRHESLQGPFTVTLSAGVAEYPRCATAAELSLAADAALYQAKQEGRDRVVLAGRAAARSILVIDDEARIAKLLRALLEEEGHHVRTANDGAAGWAAVVADPPDLVISDVLLPKLGGFELCERIKAEPQFAGVRVMLMTAVYKKDVYRTRVKEVGADDFVEKPFEPHDMLRRVRALLAGPPPPEDQNPTERGDHASTD